MGWVYLSPHLDDACLSCGGLIWEQSQAGEVVEIWTVCAGDPPGGGLSPFAEDLHRRWKAGALAPARRRLEDLEACARLGATGRHLPLPDCIYRFDEDGTPLYPSEASLWGEIHSAEGRLVEWLTREIEREVPLGSQVVSPLAIGGHVDHRLTRRATENLKTSLWYYADYPYVVKNQGRPDEVEWTNWEKRLFPISDQGLHAWQDAISAYESQISSFWPDLTSMRDAIDKYCQEQGGILLWRDFHYR